MCMELKNPWNDNKPVKISRDGQVKCCVFARYMFFCHYLRVPRCCMLLISCVFFLIVLVKTNTPPSFGVDTITITTCTYPLCMHRSVC